MDLLIIDQMSGRFGDISLTSLLFERMPHTPTEELTGSLDEITCWRLIASADVLTKKKKKRAHDRQIPLISGALETSV